MVGHSMSNRLLDDARVLHSLDGGVTPFDFDAVIENLDGPQSDDSYRIEVAREIEMVLRWIVATSPCMRRRSIQFMTSRKAHVLAWMAAPGALNHMSMRQLARYLGVDHARLVVIAARVKRELHFKNRTEPGCLSAPFRALV